MGCRLNPMGSHGSAAWLIGGHVMGMAGDRHAAELAGDVSVRRAVTATHLQPRVREVAL